MEQATERQHWLQAVCNLEQGARLNQLLSIMSGGQSAYVQWSFPLLQEGYQLPEDPAEYLQQQLSLSDLQTPWPQWDNLWHAAGITQERTGGTGVIVVLAYARQEEFDQAQLQQALSWLQQMQQQPFPVRLLLLAFSRANDSDGTDPELQAWQWEELLETGIQMVIGQAAMLEEVLVLPLVVYPEWLNRLAEPETQAHRNE